MRYVVIATPEEQALIAEFIPAFAADPVIVTGPGGLNVIRALADLPRDSEIINIGYAGSVDLTIGAAVHVGVVSTFHPHCRILETPAATTLESGTVHCYTSTDFVTEGHKKGCVYDMELAFIAALGFRRLSSVKVISDHCDLSEYHDTIKSYHA